MLEILSSWQGADMQIQGQSVALYNDESQTVQAVYVQQDGLQNTPKDRAACLCYTRHKELATWLWRFSVPC